MHTEVSTRHNQFTNYLLEGKTHRQLKDRLNAAGFSQLQHSDYIRHNTPAGLA
jgi:hypothetical protein